MEWITLITTLLPMILELFNKAERGTEGRAEMKAIGNILKTSTVPESRVVGIMLSCCADNAELRVLQKQQLEMAMVEQSAKYAAMQAETAKTGETAA